MSGLLGAVMLSKTNDLQCYVSTFYGVNPNNRQDLQLWGHTSDTADSNVQ